MNKYKIDKEKLIELATKQQISAADPHNSVWVEASAGTGKTKVLSDRVLRLLLSKVEPSKILCLTYTKAAAVEMSERITKRLSQWSTENYDKLDKELSKLLGDEYNKKDKEELINFSRTLFAALLDTPGGMKIQTIHSFCQDILKRFPLEAGISPYFEVMDDRASKEILNNIKLDLLKNIDDSDDKLKQSISYLVKIVSEFKFPEIMNMITTNRGKINSLFKKYNNNFQAIIRALEQNLNVSSDTTIDKIKEDALSKIDKDFIFNVVKTLRKGGKTDNKNADLFVLMLENNLSTDIYDSYCKIFLTDSGEVRAKLLSKDIMEKYPNIFEFMQNEAIRLIEYNNKIKSLNVLLSTSALLFIAKNIIDKYNLYKNIYSTLDYEDLIVITKNLLENKSVADWVLFKLDGGIEHILIDEAQDTSPNQWAIIKAITQEFFAGLGSNEKELQRTVFVVGDRKQSIYSFQGADPNEFDKMYNYFKYSAQNFKKIHLDVSFRSTKAIMDCVNTLFESDKAKKGVVPEGEKINHIPFRLGDGGIVEINPITKIAKDEKKDIYSWNLPVNREHKVSVSSLLAKEIALNIKNMVETKQILSSKNRPIRYGDFMFLVQQRNVFVEEFVRACKEIGVNVAGVDKLKLLEQIAVQDLISLGKFLLLPEDDLSLAEILKSPIFGLDDDDLIELCVNRKSSLFENLIKNNKYKNVSSTILELLNMSGFVRPFELFNHILAKLNGRKNFVIRMGIEVEDVLDEFLNLTILFEQTNTPTLQNFISWIVKDEVIVQKEMEQGSNDTIKIMTVHGSKGLQAPIVILADTTRIKNKSKKSDLLWDDDLVYFPSCSADYEKNCTLINEKFLDAAFDEYRRLLYVALTRAEDRLYIAGYTKNDDADSESWYKLLQNNISSNVSVLDKKKIVYEIPQENAFEEGVITNQYPIETFNYSYLLSPAPIDTPLSKPYAPSKNESDEVEIVSSPLDDSGKFYRRGTAIHKLLQYISTIKLENRFNASVEFMKKQLPEFSYDEIIIAVNEVLSLCDKYRDIFTENSMAEVPIIGEVDGKILSAKIDRLVVTDDRVIIVDYKTNRPSAKTLADVPQVYIKQLNLYKSLLKNIYPNKLIDSYLLWTNTCNMMKI